MKKQSTAPCTHELIAIGAHPGFSRTGWICMSCGAKLGDVDLGTYDGVVFAAFRKVERGAR